MAIKYIPELYYEYYGIYKQLSCPDILESQYAGTLFTSTNHLKFDGIRKANILLWHHHGVDEHGIKKMFMTRYNIPTSIEWIKNHMIKSSKTQINSVRYRINNIYPSMPSDIKNIKINQKIIYPIYKHTSYLFNYNNINMTFNTLIEFLCLTPYHHKFKELYM